MRSVYPIGTTIYKPDKCDNGYTLVWIGKSAKLVDMNGRAVHKWRIDINADKNTPQGFYKGLHRAKLLNNGHCVVQTGDMMCEDGRTVEFDWDNNPVWEFIPEGKIPHKKYLGPHHDFFRKPDGNTLIICREAVPEEYMRKVRDPRYRNMTLYGDVILEVNQKSEVVWEWHCFEHLDLNHYRFFASQNWHGGPYNNTACDWTHVNTVQAIPENRWYDTGDERFKPGNVMISPRTMDTVYLIDRDTKEIVWEYSGNYFGGLSGQHEPYMIEKGLPGEGNVLIFDNGASPLKDLGHTGKSYVLEVNPVTKEIVWVYDKGLYFYSTFTSSAQRLGNGNTLICESIARRLFEVTKEGEIVWEYIDRTPRSYRYPYNYCPQTSALGNPREVSVTPPKELRIPPDEAL